MYTDRRLARTRSCPTLFAVLKEEMTQGKKIRLSKGTLDYIKNKKNGKLYKSTSSIELETILECEEEAESVFDDDSLSSCSLSSSHSEPVDIHQSVVNTAGNGIDSINKSFLPLSSKCRISPRRINQWSNTVAVQRHFPKNVVDSRQCNGSSYQPIAVSSTIDRSEKEWHREQYSSMYDKETVVKSQSKESQASEPTTRTTLDVNFQQWKERNDLLPFWNKNTTQTDSLWLPPVEWKIEKMENIIWMDHQVHKNEEGGWWMERWATNLQRIQRLGDKFGVDADGIPWSEWWIEIDRGEYLEGRFISKSGQKWGRNAKGERWYETWNIDSNGHVYTQFRLERANSSRSLVIQKET
eukprot:jgi/Galph1/538/GphlegSOOS_G5228.1